jgi:hypothetical protein
LNYLIDFEAFELAKLVKLNEIKLILTSVFGENLSEGVIFTVKSVIRVLPRLIFGFWPILRL